MDVIKYKYVFIGFSAALLILAAASMLTFGFKQGIDFVGGTFWQVRFLPSVNVSNADLVQFLSSQNLENVLVRQGETAQDFSIRTKEMSEAKHQEVLQLMQTNFGAVEELSFASIGPAVGKELRNRSLLAFVLVLFGISLYIAFAFRKVSYPVSSWKYGFVTLITLFHDALIPAGVFAYLGHIQGAEVDTNFIVAILVIMGFSVHDTIVVFDRIRERLLHTKKQENLGELINASIRQTFARSVNTSLTMVIVLIALYLLGAPSFKTFTLIILIGTVIGAYSSIFVASPLLTFFKSKE
jgi:preprotein translocase subunit SecF